MTVFISHSFDDRSAFDNVAFALRMAGATHWPPTSVHAGEPLRTQLHDAVGGCGVCVFVATRESVVSEWCHTELGAFWGVGRPIVVFRADASLTSEDLPSIVRDDVWEDRLERLAVRVKELDDTAQAVGGTLVSGSTRVGNLTVDQLLPQLADGVVALLKAEAAKTGTTPWGMGVRAVRQAAGQLLHGVDVTSRVGAEDEGWRRHILWVDDNPDNNMHERQAMKAAGLELTLATSTEEALGLLGKRRFAAVISDMGRREGPREGYVLLEALRRTNTATPFFIYAGSRDPAHRVEATERGAQGTTNRAEELVEMVVTAVGATVPQR